MHAIIQLNYVHMIFAYNFKVCLKFALVIANFLKN